MSALEEVRVARTRFVVLMGALVAGAGCGSNGGTNSMNDGGIPPGSGTLTWKDGATLYSALGPSAARVINASLDMVQIAGGVAAGTAVSFAVTTAPPLIPGLYSCSESGTGGRIVSISYVEGSVASSGVPTCTIDIASIGDTTGTRVTGTFSATVSVGGTTRNITDGVFDVELVVMSL